MTPRPVQQVVAAENLPARNGLSDAGQRAVAAMRGSGAHIWQWELSDPNYGVTYGPPTLRIGGND